MTEQIKSSNPVVAAIIKGKVPPSARLAAARGLLPLAQVDLLEVLVALEKSDDTELASAARQTLASQEQQGILLIAEDKETAPTVLGYLAKLPNAGKQIHEAVALNTSTPDDAIAQLAATTKEGNILEIIALNQQRLVRSPYIIDAILANPAKTIEAERRAKETRTEFFEKERGVQQIADEFRARSQVVQELRESGQFAAAEFIEVAESIGVEEGLAAEDVWIIAKHIEVTDDELLIEDDSWLGLEIIEEIYEESFETRLANAERIIGETLMEEGEQADERVLLIRKIMVMSVKDRMKLALKGDREARSILIRDSNRIVSTGVIKNPRITDQEVEAIASMRTVSNEVLRLISLNKNWARQYPIIHNLARNPRTPVPTAIGILPRIYTKDLKGISQNRNVSEAVRRQANRLFMTRGGG
jgi:hypothetical protein